MVFLRLFGLFLVSSVTAAMSKRCPAFSVSARGGAHVASVAAGSCSRSTGTFKVTIHCCADGSWAKTHWSGSTHPAMRGGHTTCATSRHHAQTGCPGYTPAEFCPAGHLRSRWYTYRCDALATRFGPTATTTTTTTTAHPIPPLFPVGVHPLPKDTSLVPSAGVHPCSHVYCKAEKHKCSRFNTDATTRMWDANAPGKRLFDPHKATCTGKSEHWSVRVFHHGKESVCDAAHGGHICGLGTFSGDRTKCECKPCTTCPRRTTTAAPSTSQQQQQQHPPIPTEAEQRCTWQDEGFGELAWAGPGPCSGSYTIACKQGSLMRTACNPVVPGVHTAEACKAACAAALDCKYAYVRGTQCHNALDCGVSPHCSGTRSISDLDSHMAQVNALCDGKWKGYYSCSAGSTAGARIPHARPSGCYHSSAINPNSPGGVMQGGTKTDGMGHAWQKTKCVKTGWSKWSKWSACSATCGSTATKVRRRSCLDPTTTTTAPPAPVSVTNPPLGYSNTGRLTDGVVGWDFRKGLHNFKTMQQCADFCSADSTCVGFLYYAGAGPAASHSPGRCQPGRSWHGTGVTANAGYHKGIFGFSKDPTTSRRLIEASTCAGATTEATPCSSSPLPACPTTTTTTTTTTTAAPVALDTKCFDVRPQDAKFFPAALPEGFVLSHNTADGTLGDFDPWKWNANGVKTLAECAAFCRDHPKCTNFQYVINPAGANAAHVKKFATGKYAPRVGRCQPGVGYSGGTANSPSWVEGIYNFAKPSSCKAALCCKKQWPYAAATTTTTAAPTAASTECPKSLAEYKQGGGSGSHVISAQTAPSFAACVAKCNADPTCKSFGWYSYNASCRLFKDAGNNYPHGAQSARGEYCGTPGCTWYCSFSKVATTTTTTTTAAPTTTTTADPSAGSFTASLGAMSGVPARTYEFRRVNPTPPFTGSTNDMMFKVCGEYGMKPVCDHPSTCKSDDRSLYFGQTTYLSAPDCRGGLKITATNTPTGYMAIAQRWRNACGYRAPGQRAMCNYPRYGGCYGWGKVISDGTMQHDDGNHGVVPFMCGKVKTAPTTTTTAAPTAASTECPKSLAEYKQGGGSGSHVISAQTAPSFAACVAKCNADPTCKSFGWYSYNASCRLFKDAGNNYPHGAQSARGEYCGTPGCTWYCSFSKVATTTTTTTAAPVALESEWSAWSSWSGCTATCGAASKVRARSCTGASCTGSATDIEPCSDDPLPCPVAGGWSAWGGFSACTKSCGGGLQTRTRACGSPAPAHGGDECAGTPSEDRQCNTHARCPVAAITVPAGFSLANRIISGTTDRHITNHYHLTLVECAASCAARSGCVGFIFWLGANTSSPGRCQTGNAWRAPNSPPTSMGDHDGLINFAKDAQCASIECCKNDDVACNWETPFCAGTPSACTN